MNLLLPADNVDRSFHEYKPSTAFCMNNVAVHLFNETIKQFLKSRRFLKPYITKEIQMTVMKVKCYI